MKILKRYVVKEFLPSFLLGFSIFTFILFVTHIFPLIRILFHQGIELQTVARLFLYTFSFILPYSISMGVLFGSINSLGRLFYDGEVTGIQASGLAVSVITFPLFLLAFLISFLCLYLFSEVSPSVKFGIEQIEEELKIEKVSDTTEENLIMDNFKNYTIYIDRLEGTKIEGITVFKFKDEGPPSVITAQKAKLVTDGQSHIQQLKLIDGTIHDIEEKNLEEFSKGYFKTYYINLEPTGREIKKGPSDMTMGELRKHIGYFREKGLTNFPLLTEMHKRFSLSFSPLFFVLIGSMLGMKMTGKSKTKGFALSMLVALFYYIVFLAAEIVSQKGAFSPFVMVWIPNILLAGFCLLLILKREL